jgi:hypothetical protein
MGMYVNGQWHEELADNTKDGSGASQETRQAQMNAPGYTPAPAPTPSAPGTNPLGNMEQFNLGAAQLQQTAAQQAAYQAYLNKRMELIDMPGVQLEKDKLALQAAQEKYTEVIGTANITGFMPDGTPTFASKQWTTSETGNIDGQRTMAGQLQDSTLTGKFNGQDTEDTRRFNEQNALQTRDRDLAARTQQSNEAMEAMKLQASMRGPRNAFQQQAVNQGLNDSGLSRSVDAIAGRYTPALGGPSFAAPQSATLGSQVQDMHTNMSGQVQPFVMSNGNQGPLTSVELAQGTQQAQQQAQTNAGGAMTGSSQYTPYNAQQYQQQQTAQNMQPNTSIADYQNALVAPNKIVGRNWAQLGTDDREFLTGAYETTGRSANDLNDSIARGMPQFKAPKYGLVGR